MKVGSYIFARMKQFEGKVAVVTGAARGMGRAHALLLAERGARVAVTDVAEEACKKVVEEIVAGGGEGVGFAMDVADRGSVEKVFDRITSQWGGIDVLINNAGVLGGGEALSMKEEEWDRVLDINLKGQFLCAQAAARFMKDRGRGAIVNISSIASGQVGVGMIGLANYTASKGGVIGLTETLAAEWAHLGIRVNALAPGVIDTPMVSESGMSGEEVQAILARVPLKRMGHPEEIARAAAFLASDEASYVTGAMLVVDGGWLAS